MKTSLISVLLTISVLTFSQINFDSFQLFSTGATTENIAIGDLDNDSLNDVVIATSGWLENNQYSYKLMIFNQDISGGFNGPDIINYPTIDYDGASSIDIGDFNSDSLNDIVIGYSDSIMIYFQNKQLNGKFDSTIKYHCGTYVDAFKVIDMNNDSLVDIVVMLADASYLRIFYQTKPCGFYTKDYISPHTWRTSLEVADINNDELLDILLLSDIAGFNLIKQTGKEIFNSPVKYNLEGSSLTGIAVEDLNNDNRNDIVITSSINDAFIYIYYNNGSNNFFSNPLKIEAYDIPEPVQIADINCDGNKEIIIAHQGWHALTVYDKIPSNDYSEYLRFKNVYGHYDPENKCMAIGDLNNDNSPDIAIASGDNGWVFFPNSSRPYVSDSITSEKILFSDTSITSYIQVDTSAIDTIDRFVILKIDSLSIKKTNIFQNLKVFKWYIREGNICSGYFKDSIVVDSTYQQKSLITLDTLNIITSVDTLLISKLIEYESEVNIQVYPNPSSGGFTIEFKNAHQSQINIQIYNENGEKIYESNSYNETYKLLEIKHKGVYYMIFRFNDNTISKKIIII